MSLKYKIIFILIIIVSSFLIGRMTSPEKLITETKIEKYRDEEAIKIAVEQAIQKTQSEFKKKVVIDRIKTKDGKETIHKEIFTESVKLSESLSLGIKKEDMKVRDYELTELKSPLKRFSIDIIGGVEYILPSSTSELNLSNLHNFDAYISSKASYRIIEKIWLGVGAKKYFTKNQNIAFIEAEYRTYLW